MFNQVLYVDNLNPKFRGHWLRIVGTRALERGQILPRESVFWPFHLDNTFKMTFDGQVTLTKVVGHVSIDLDTNFQHTEAIFVVWRGENAKNLVTRAFFDKKHRLYASTWPSIKKSR